MKLLEAAGFKVLHEKRSDSLATIRAIVNAGSTSEAEEKDYGVAHFLEHMFFKGTTKQGYKELNKKLTRLGSHNAYTSRDRTVYHMMFLPQKFSTAVDLLTEMIFEAVCDPEEFEKERGVILEEVQMYLLLFQWHMLCLIQFWDSIQSFFTRCIPHGFTSIN